MAQAQGSAGAAAAPDVSYRYLYQGNAQNQPGYVREHIAPATSTEQISDQPNFVFSEDQGFRVVIFYIDWCPVCQDVVPQFIEFAQRMQTYNVSVHAVSCMVNKYLCLRLNLPGYPMIRLYAPGQVVNGQELSLSELHPLRVLEHFHIPLDSRAKQALLEDLPVASSSLKRPIDWKSRLSNWFFFWRSRSSFATGPSYRRTPHELESDIHLSLDWTLRHSVFTTTPDESSSLSEEAKTALLHWLLIMDKTLPPSWEQLHTLLHELVGNFLFATKSEDYLVSFLDRYPPNATHWSGGCTGGVEQPHHNGYSCGLWTMFHAVTVGTVEFNILSMKRNRLATDEVAKYVRDFVEHFFNCLSCRQHFVESFDSCEHRRCHLLTVEAQNQTLPAEWRQLPLWLARAHNDVNLQKVQKQLARSGLEATTTQRLAETDPAMVNAAWPRAIDCKSCWTSTTNPGTRQWAEDSVYEYLKREYFTAYPSHDTTPGARVMVGSDASNSVETVQFRHFVASCVLLALLFGLWGGARSLLRRLEDRLSPKRRHE